MLNKSAVGTDVVDVLPEDNVDIFCDGKKVDVTNVIVVVIDDVFADELVNVPSVLLGEVVEERKLDVCSAVLGYFELKDATIDGLGGIVTDNVIDVCSVVLGLITIV